MNIMKIGMYIMLATVLIPIIAKFVSDAQADSNVSSNTGVVALLGIILIALVAGIVMYAWKSFGSRDM